jgi:hypothetical protein
MAGIVKNNHIAYYKWVLKIFLKDIIRFLNSDTAKLRNCSHLLVYTIINTYTTRFYVWFFNKRPLLAVQSSSYCV